MICRDGIPRSARSAVGIVLVYFVALGVKM